MNKVTSNNNVITVSLPTAQYGPQGQQGLPGPSGSQGLSGIQGPSGSQGFPRNLQENLETGAITTIPITGSIISASSFTGSLYGTSSHTLTSLFAISASYAPFSSESLQGEQAIELLNAAPQQLYFNTASKSSGALEKNEWFASTDLKWEFTAPISGQAILTIPYIRSSMSFSGPGSAFRIGGTRIALSQTSPISSSIIIDNSNIDNYGPFSNTTVLWLWGPDGDGGDSFLTFGPINLIESNLTPGQDYTYYLYCQAYLINGLSSYTMNIDIQNYLQATSVVTTT
jgi:hypothetical protein